MPPSLPAVPLDDGNSTVRRASVTHALPEVPSGSVALPESVALPDFPTETVALPDVPQDPKGLGVASIHQGSHKEGDGVVPPAVQEVVRNMRGALAKTVGMASLMEVQKRCIKGRRITLATVIDMLAGSKTTGAHVSVADRAISAMSGLSCHTVSSIHRRMRASSGQAWQPQGAGGRPHLAEQRTEAADTLRDDVDIFLDSDLVGVAGVAGPVRDTGSVGSAGVIQPSPQTEKVQFTRHDLGLHVGRLATFVYTNPLLPAKSYTSLVSLMDAMSPGCLGSTNHGVKFCLNFGRTLAAQLQFCIGMQHWARIPALGLPSDFARVLDGYTCLGESCQVLIHTITLQSGELAWLLLDVVANAAAVPMASASSGSRSMLSHCLLCRHCCRVSPGARQDSWGRRELGACSSGFRRMVVRIYRGAPRGSSGFLGGDPNATKPLISSGPFTSSRRRSLRCH